MAKHLDKLNPAELAEWSENEALLKAARAKRTRFLHRMRQRAWKMGREGNGRAD